MFFTKFTPKETNCLLMYIPCDLSLKSKLLESPKLKNQIRSVHDIRTNLSRKRKKCMLGQSGVVSKVKITL